MKITIFPTYVWLHIDTCKERIHFRRRQFCCGAKRLDLYAKRKEKYWLQSAPFNHSIQIFMNASGSLVLIGVTEKWCVSTAPLCFDMFERNTACCQLIFLSFSSLWHRWQGTGSMRITRNVEKPRPFVERNEKIFYEVEFTVGQQHRSLG